MSMKYPKHLLEIEGNVLDIGNGISIEEDKNSLIATLSFSIPLLKKNNFDTTFIKRDDVIKLYYNLFNSLEEAQNANITNMVTIFNGYVRVIEVNENKSNGVQFSLQCETSMALAGERSMLVSAFEGSMQQLIDTADGNNVEGGNGLNFQSIVPLNLRYIDDFPENFIFKIDTSPFFKKVLDSIRDKYAVDIYQNAAGELHIEEPLYFTNESSTQYEYDLQSNVFDIDYGDLVQKVDSVIVIGEGAYGFAFDPIAYQLKQGVTTENLQTNVQPERNKLNPFYMYRRDEFSPQSLNTIAKNKLIEFAKNNTITLQVDFIPTQKLNDIFIVKNSSIIDENQKWIITKRSISIGKDGIQCTIVGYSNGIVDFPEELLTSEISGLLDINTYNNEQKEEVFSLILN